jgi:hypothetical protein
MQGHLPIPVAVPARDLPQPGSARQSLARMAHQHQGQGPYWSPSCCQQRQQQLLLVLQDPPGSRGWQSQQPALHQSFALTQLRNGKVHEVSMPHGAKEANKKFLAAPPSMQMRCFCCLQSINVHSVSFALKPQLRIHHHQPPGSSTSNNAPKPPSLARTANHSPIILK